MCDGHIDQMTQIHYTKVCHPANGCSTSNFTLLPDEAGKRKIFKKWISSGNELLKVKCVQRSGTAAIRTQIQPLKPKRETSIVTNSQNTKRIYGQTSDQLFPKKVGYQQHNFFHCLEVSWKEDQIISAQHE